MSVFPVIVLVPLLKNKYYIICRWDVQNSRGTLRGDVEDSRGAVVRSSEAIEPRGL